MKHASAFRAALRFTATLGLAAVVTTAAADTGPIAFPLYQTHVLYAVYDVARVKQVREAYINPEALKKIRPGEPLPEGTVITMPGFKAVLDEHGEPLKDANGRYIRGSLELVLVMEKRAGWGAEIPEDLRNGDWRYQRFHPDGTRDDKVAEKACLGCHKPKRADDYLFTAQDLIDFARE